jgi:hypothetical protein
MGRVQAPELSFITSKRGDIVSEGSTQIRVRNEYGFQQLGKEMDLATHHPYTLASDYESFSTFTKFGGITYPEGYVEGPNALIQGNRTIDYDGYADNPYRLLYDYQDEIFTKGQYLTNYVSLANNIGKTRIFASLKIIKNEV